MWIPTGYGLTSLLDSIFFRVASRIFARSKSYSRRGAAIKLAVIFKQGPEAIWSKLLRVLLAYAVAFLFLAPFACAVDTPLRLVVVTSVHSPFGTLNRGQIRKIYLGSSDVTPKSIQPLINQSDRMLHEMFLQKVLFMSEKAYERYVRHKNFPSDTVMPVTYRSEDRLIEYLNAHPNAITCLSEQTAAQWPSLKVVTRL